MSDKTISPGDVSLPARELHCVLQAAFTLDSGDPQASMLFSAAERLSGLLENMTEKAERRGYK